MRRFSAEPLTEQPNPSTVDLDLLDTQDMLHRINDEDRRVAWAVEREIDVIAAAVDEITARLRAGGRLHYFGAGTSGRLAVLDAAEIPPTFSTPYDLVVAHIAGGREAILRAVEAAEDDEAAGVREAAGLTASDAVIGISASGGARYVLGAVAGAGRRGCLTVGLTNSSSSPLAGQVQIPIVLLSGPEVLSGSTRMKAGSAQKMALNMISTAVMVKLGKAYGNLMVDLQATNNKLRLRAQRLTKQLTGAADDDVVRALESTGYRVKPAVVALKLGCDALHAQALLEAAGGQLRAVIG